MRYSVLYLLLSVVLSFLGLVRDDVYSNRKIERQIKLAPRSKNNLSFNADRDLRVSFSTQMSSDELSKCQNQCITMLNLDKRRGEVVSATKSAFLQVEPVNGRASVILQNNEAFSIKVKVIAQ